MTDLTKTFKMPHELKYNEDDRSFLTEENIDHSIEMGAKLGIIDKEFYEFYKKVEKACKKEKFKVIK